MRRNPAQKGRTFKRPTPPKSGRQQVYPLTSGIYALTQLPAAVPSALDYPHLRNFSADPMSMFGGDMSALRFIVQLALED